MRRASLSLVCSIILISFAALACGCGGPAQSSGDTGPGGAGSAGAAGNAGAAGGGTGGDGTGGSGPMPVPVDCAHHGSGLDIQVGNPTVESGPDIVQVDSIGEVDWNSLAAGDTVRIFWREQPYHEKILVSGQGTPDQPIVVCGVPGPDGQLPRISGQDATTRPDLDYGDLDNLMEDLGVVTIWNRHYEVRAEYIHIEGLAISDTMGMPGAPGDEHQYTATDGSTRTYRPAAACIRVQEGKGIVLRGNELSGCGNGLFLLARIPESQMTREVLIESNYLHDNGVVGEEGIHTAYVQGIDITVQFNWFGPTRAGAGGNTLKMRVAGDVVRYNVFERGARILDFVEVEDHAALVIPALFEEFKQNDPAEVTPGDEERVAAAWKAYQETHAYGNVLFNTGTAAATNLVHYSFDNIQNDRRPGTLHFYDNTVVNLTDFDDKDIVRLVDQGPWWGNSGPPVTNNTYDDYAVVVAFNNVIYLGSETAGQQASYFEFTRYRADKLSLGTNWISTGWDEAVPGYEQAFPGYGNALVDDPEYVYPGGNDQHHVTGANNLVTGDGLPIDLATFRPLAGSPLLGAGALIPPLLAPAHTPLYELDAVSRKPVPRAKVTTIGAYEEP